MSRLTVYQLSVRVWFCQCSSADDSVSLTEGEIDTMTSVDIGSLQDLMARYAMHVFFIVFHFNSIHYVFASICSFVFCLQCFDAVGWAAGRASGL